MGMTVSYLTIDGEILSETRGGVEHDYLPDALGSTIALLDSNQNVTNAMDYWPYGEEKVGNSTLTPFRYVGTFGYYTDVLNSRVYVRARNYLPQYARWMTVDLLWPNLAPYEYASGEPVLKIDPSGRQPLTWQSPNFSFNCPDNPEIPKKYNTLCDMIHKCFYNPPCWKQIQACWSDNGKHGSDADCMATYCGHPTVLGGKPPRMDITCGGMICYCGGCAYHSWWNGSCRIRLCLDNKSKTCTSTSGYYNDGLLDTIIHEMSHCCGTGDGTGDQAATIAFCMGDVFEHFGL